ncbi:class I SAM-dependent methyltransferase [Taklimakanibacter deserti]|uniref:class I SAM-dependent methyltransferase n=1 Tax=Taklimakanibacter deserti TaxID=2267839 RepID=UPI000E6572B6
MTNPDYVLGHSAFELERLARQERLIGPTTRDYFHHANILPGMRVLDVGSGTGVVAFLAAELVGPSGEVVGTDLAPTAVATANEAAAARGLAQVVFRQGDPADMEFERPFDAIVGRYVLWCQADPDAMLRKLARHLRPGGVIVFHEMDWSFVRSVPAAPTYDRCCRWISDTFDRAGTNIDMSARLHRAFVDAGLPPPTMRMQAVIGDAVSAAEWLRAMADLALVMAPTMEKQGVATAAEIGIDTLADRLVQEVAIGGGIVVGRSEIGAWVRIQP